MGKSKRDTEKAAKKSKVVTMPRRDGGEDAEGAKGKKKAAVRKPKSGRATAKEKSKKTPAEKIKKEEYKGAKKALRHWVKKVVKNHSPKIAETLVGRTEAGDMHSAAMVLALMEKKKKKGGEDGDLDGPSLAEQLMEGPTWEEVLEARRKAKEEEEEAAAAS
ncbi:MAG: hypothetical protein WCF30_18570 [Terracidiphilus sp.]